MTFFELDYVQVKRRIGENPGIKPGMTGTVLNVYSKTQEYDVEFLDGKGVFWTL